jgi:hypothetical protein
MIQKHNKPEEAHTGTPESEGLERIEELIGLGRPAASRPGGGQPMF